MEFALSREDYARDFHSLVPRLNEVWGERFQAAVIRPPTEAYTVIELTTKEPRTGEVYHHLYRLDHLTVTPLSALIGRKVIKEWMNSVRALKRYRIAAERIRPFKEELIAAAWSPARVERLLAAGGFDALD